MAQTDCARHFCSWLNLKFTPRSQAGAGGCKIKKWMRVSIFKMDQTIITGWWYPDSWKIKTMTIIPQKDSPESFAHTRNISLTPTLSKLCKRSVLAFLEQTGLQNLNHCQNIEGCRWKKNMAALTSIDFAKAFHRVNHKLLILTWMRKAGVWGLSLATWITVKWSFGIESTVSSRKIKWVKAGSLSELRWYGFPHVELGSNLFCRIKWNEVGLEPKSMFYNKWNQNRNKKICSHYNGQLESCKASEISMNSCRLDEIFCCRGVRMASRIPAEREKGIYLVIHLAQSLQIS